jgi:hypothetical protein
VANEPDTAKWHWAEVAFDRWHDGLPDLRAVRPRCLDETGLAFGIGYLLVVIVHAALYAETYGAATLRFVPLNIIGALSVIAAGLVHGPVDYFLWLVPVLLQYLTSILARHVDERSRA